MVPLLCLGCNSESRNFKSRVCHLLEVLIDTLLLPRQTAKGGLCWVEQLGSSAKMYSLVKLHDGFQD
jgi:hypothetical protein